MSGVDDFRIGTMRRDEIDFAIDLAAQEGWNPGLHDAECFYAADPGGFLIGQLRNEPIGCISAVSYAGRHGFIGLYIVRPAFRGHGYGLRLWHAALARLAGHNVGLDGVVAQQPNYVKSGFHLAHRNVRYRGRAHSAATDESVRRATQSDLSAIAEFDRKIFPERRDPFLEHWVSQPMAGAYVASYGRELTGYTVVRKCREGWKIGPLAADSVAIARHLYDAACAHAGPGDTIFVDVPAANPAAESLLTTRDFAPVFETARMYTGAAPAIDLSRLFGVTTFELG